MVVEDTQVRNYKILNDTKIYKKKEFFSYFGRLFIWSIDLINIWSKSHMLCLFVCFFMGTWHIVFKRDKKAKPGILKSSKRRCQENVPTQIQTIVVKL